jgi:hypothetical protein
MSKKAACSPHRPQLTHKLVTEYSVRSHLDKEHTTNDTQKRDTAREPS